MYRYHAAGGGGIDLSASMVSQCRHIFWIKPVLMLSDSLMGDCPFCRLEGIRS